MGCSREATRVVLWMIWVTVWLITSIYVAVAVITFGKLWQAATEFQYGPEDLVKNKIWRAPLASLVLSALLVFGFNMTSCVTLIKKSINRGGPGFGYGFMIAYSMSLSFFLLLCGLVLDGFRPEVSQHLEFVDYGNGTTSGAVSWSKWSSEGYIGAEVLALLSFCTYFLFSIALVLLQGAVSDQLGMGNSPVNKYDAEGLTALTAVPLQDQQPAAPEADHYGPKYDQYGSYNDNSQQFYDPNTGVYTTGMPANGTIPAGYYNGAHAAAAALAQAAMGQPYTAASTPTIAPPAYANVGFAAMGMYNTISAPSEGGAQPGGLPSGQAHNAAAYSYTNNQQV